MTTKLIWITPDAEKLLGYIARVSNPQNQDNENVEGLLRYMVKHQASGGTPILATSEKSWPSSTG